MPPLDADARDFARLRDMYKRYMLNPAVSRWLLPRDAPSDFHVVRKERAVQFCVSPASPPEVIPDHAPHAPFPVADDLMFLERNHAGFALGHVWGCLRTEQHPYAPLAARAGKAGWDKVRSRKFASDITVPDALEFVEYTWFMNDRAIVTLSRIPFAPGKRKVRISEVLFFARVDRTDIPPQRPELVLLVHERGCCSACASEICCCPNSLGINRGSLADLAPKSSCATPCPTSPCIKMPWEHRMRMMYHGNKRGLLTIVYSTSTNKDTPRITVRQAFVSVCANQDAIAYRIQQQLTKFLAKLPRAAEQAQLCTMAMEANTADTSAMQRSDECDMPFPPELSGQSPVSFTPTPSSATMLQREGAWFEPQRPKARPADCKPEATVCDGGQSSCCPPPNTSLGAKTGSPIQNTPKSDVAIKNGSAASIPSLRSAADSYSRENAMQNTLCGPGKTGMDCECSAENMQDPSLALILNSRRDLPVANPMAEMSAFIEPIMEPTNGNVNGGGEVLMQPVPSLRHRAAVGMLREDDRSGVGNFVSTVRFDSDSPESTRLGGGVALPPPLLPEEPPLKRPRGDATPKTDAFGLGLEPCWPTVGFDERDKGIHLPPWSISAIPERPLSALSRALGMARSPSPLALMTSLPKTSSPQSVPVTGSSVGFPKLSNQDGDFQNQFDSTVAVNENESISRQDRKGMPSVPTQLGNNVPKRDASPMGGSRNTSEGAITNGSEASAGNGVCCEICGISFAKRSNKLRHIQTVHNRLKQFECDLCGTKFGLKADLGRHRFRIHESRAFCCETCGRSFAEQGQLDLHIRVTHEEDSRPWECSQCRIRFGRKSSLTRHEQTVHQQTRFTCRVCKKSYSQKFDAVRHERKVHGLDTKGNG